MASGISESSRNPKTSKKSQQNKPTVDYHTHNPNIPPGTGIINLSRAVIQAPDTFQPVPGGLYSAGIHPWWTSDEHLEQEQRGVAQLAQHPQVVVIGECGLDTLRGGSLDRQLALLKWHIQLAAAVRKPLTLHCVRAFHLLLALSKELKAQASQTAQASPISQISPTIQPLPVLLPRMVIHGFRGGPALAAQLLSAGFELSFGPRHNPASFQQTPPHLRHQETDAEPS